MRHLNEYQHHLRVLLEPYDAKVSRTVLRGESPSNGADLLDFIGRPRHQQDSRLVVRRVHLPDCCRHHPALILPLINNVWLNTR